MSQSYQTLAGYQIQLRWWLKWAHGHHNHGDPPQSGFHCFIGWKSAVMILLRRCLECLKNYFHLWGLRKSLVAPPLVIFSRAFRTSESESKNFGLWKPFGLGLSVFVSLRIYTVKKSTFHKKNPKFQFFLFLNPMFPACTDIYYIVKMS
jgi:hypothetical protein